MKMKRLVSLLLTVAMLLSIVPTPAFAEEEPVQEAPAAAEEVKAEPTPKPTEKPAAKEEPAPKQEPAEAEKPAEEPKATEKPVEEPKAAEKPAEEPKQEEPAPEVKEEQPAPEQKEEAVVPSAPEQTEEPVEEPAEEEPVEEPAGTENEPEAEPAEEPVPEKESVSLNVKPLKDVRLENGAAKFTVVAEVTGEASVAYRWQVLDDSVSYKDDAEREEAWQDLKGETKKTLVFENTEYSEIKDFVYRCVVSAADITVVTEEVKLLPEKVEAVAEETEETEEQPAEEPESGEEVTEVPETDGEPAEDETVPEEDAEGTEEAITEEEPVEEPAEEAVPCEHALIYVDLTGDEFYKDGDLPGYWYCELCGAWFMDEEAQIPYETAEEVPSVLMADATSGTCGDNLSWSYANGTLTITGSGKMDNYEVSNYSWSSPKDDRPWAAFANEITNVEIGSGMTYIGFDAFCNCTNLKTVSIPASVTGIGNGAFQNCTGLKTLPMGSGVKQIGGYFITMMYGGNVFDGCTGLTSVTIPDSVEIIGASCFADCSNLTKVTLGSNVREIERCAFSGCEKLESINIPASVEMIGNYVFKVSGEGNYNFGIPRIDITDLAAWCSIRFLGSIMQRNTEMYLNGTKLTDVVIPSGVTAVSAYAFDGYENMTSLTIPSTVKTIGDYAFADTGISTVTVPASVETLGEGVFWGSRLKTATLNCRLEEIPAYTFASSSLKSVTYPSTVTKIGDYAFSSCFYDNPHMSYTIPSSVTEVGEGAFSSARFISLDLGNVRLIGNNAFSSCTWLQEVTIPETVIYIGERAFSWNEALEHVVFEGSAPEIESEAFYNVTARVDYPQNDASWTAEKKQNYGGTLGWGVDVSTSRIKVTMMLPNGSSYVWEYDYKRGGTVDLSDYTGIGGMMIFDDHSHYITGWYKDKALKVQVKSITSANTQDITLYPKYITASYSVTYVLNGGVQNTKNTATYTSDGRALYAPTRKGYEFTGWYADEELTDLWESIPEGTEGDITLYAGWELADYTITYKNAETADVINENPATYQITSPTITLVAPSRLGYTFLGWFKDAKFATKLATIKTGSTGNKVFYAKWQATKYPVSYVLNGGVQNTKNIATYTIAGRALYAPTRKGYAFTGWYTDEALTGLWTAIPEGTTEKVTLYAGWELADYTITYKNAEMEGCVNENPATYQIVDPTISLAAPSRLGYTFLGWFKDAKFATKLATIKTGSTGNKVFYAKWQATKYPVSYVLNGGTQNKKNIATYTIAGRALYAPTRKGYQFTGWYTDEALTGLWTAIPEGTTEKVTLYAGWELVDYTVTYNLKGGENAPENPETYRIVTETVTLLDPVRTGYTFKGWFSNSTCTTRAYSIKTGSTGNKTFWAKWAANKYSVVFNGNGATSGKMTALSCTYDKAIALTANAFKCAGHTFAGWNTEPDGSGVSFNNKQQIKNLTAEAGAKITLYAQWN